MLKLNSRTFHAKKAIAYSFEQGGGLAVVSLTTRNSDKATEGVMAVNFV